MKLVLTKIRASFKLLGSLYWWHRCAGLRHYILCIHGDLCYLVYVCFQTHPSQTCFMSSVDLHTHYSYQIMLPEAVAIVMAPTDTSSPHGIFHLSDPGGVSVIRNCQQRGFHPHEEPEDGSPLYEHCSHVFMNAKLQFDVVDLRWACNLLMYTKAFLLIIYSEKEITSTVNFSAADSDVN